MKPTNRFLIGLTVGFMAIALWNAHAAEPKYDPEKLRSLVKLPKMTLDFGFAVNSTLGFTLGREPLDLNKLKPPAERIAELRKDMSGGVRDAERYAELGLLYVKLHDAAQAQATRKRAVELFREQVKDDPKKGWLRSELGNALLAADQMVEGENLLRDAVALSPEDWRCWEALGDFLESRAFATLGVTNVGVLYEEIQRGLRVPGSNTASSPDRRAKARAFWDEAAHCYDKAVAVGPGEIGAYQARIVFRGALKKLLDLLIEPERSADVATKQQFVSPEVRADLKEAARLTTDDAYAIGMAAFFEAMMNAPKGAADSSGSFKRGFWLFLPDSSRAYVREALSRLEQLGRNEDKNTAGAALTALGGMQLLVQGDPVAAEDNLRRATRLRPAADTAWEMFGLLLVQSERWSELAALGEEHVKSKDSVRYRIGLAKIYEKLGKPAEVEPQVQAALKLAPDDLLANTASAAMRLKRATDEAAVAEVGQMMNKVKQTVFKAAPKEQQVGFEFLHGLYYGLAGNRQEAASHFRRLREADPDESDYRDAYDALGL